MVKIYPKIVHALKACHLSLSTKTPSTIVSLKSRRPRLSGLKQYLESDLSLLNGFRIEVAVPAPCPSVARQIAEQSGALLGSSMLEQRDRFSNRIFSKSFPRSEKLDNFGFIIGTRTFMRIKLEGKIRMDECIT